MAAVAIQGPKAHLLSSYLPFATMAAQRKQVLSVDEREGRLADAMAGLTPQAW